MWNWRVIGQVTSTNLTFSPLFSHFVPSLPLATNHASQNLLVGSGASVRFGAGGSGRKVGEGGESRKSGEGRDR